jgi:hypothetical protein
MKTIARLATLCALLGLAAGASAADLLKYKAKPGGKMRIEGTSTIHDWWSESSFVGGRLELDPSFPVDPASKEIKAGPIPATANVTILVRTFKCQWGAPMDAIMQESMNAKDHPKIEYKLKELVFKEAKDTGLVFDAKGDLTVRGQTKEVAMPVTIERPYAKMLKIKGELAVKMTDYGVPPPAPKVALGAIKTGDDVKLIFEWIVGQEAAAGS